MTSVWIHFRHHGFWVHPLALPDFLRWVAGRGGSLRAKAAVLKGATPSTELPAALVSARAVAAEARIRAGIVRCPRDSGRVQVFDLSAQLVLHMALAAESVVAEVETRTRAGAVAVPVLGLAGGGAAFVEPLLRPTRGATPADALKVLAALDRDVHRPAPTAPAAWAAARRAEANGDPTAEVAIDAIEQAMGEGPVLVGPVHGDLNPGNVYPLADGRVLLGDWEYMRDVLTTYDAWLVARYYPGVDFSEAARPVGGQMAEAPWLHAAHLVEWYTYLQTMAPHRAAGLRVRLASELDAAIRALGAPSERRPAEERMR